MTRSKKPPVAKTEVAQAAKAAIAATPEAAALPAPAKRATKKPKAAAAPVKAKVATAPAKPAPAKPAPAKPAKAKLVRDSFTIPKDEYQALDALKARALGLEQHVKKSELLRAGIQALSAMPDKAFLKAVQAVPTLKTGRPKSDA